MVLGWGEVCDFSEKRERKKYFHHESKFLVTGWEEWTVLRMVAVRTGLEFDASNWWMKRAPYIYKHS